MINYFQIVLLMILGNTLIAQQKPTPFDRLDKELRYRVLGESLQDRGEDLFAKDLEFLLAKSTVFSKYIYSNSHSFYIDFDFDEKGASVVDVMAGVPDESAKISYKNELKKLVNQLLTRIKPAVYKGKPVFKKYRMYFIIKNNKKLNVVGLRFEKSRADYYLNSTCFEVYKYKGDNALFQSVEINAQYKGDNTILTSHLNKLFNTSHFDSSGKIDSLDIDFVISKYGHFSLHGDYKSKTKTEAMIIEKLKLLSCNWDPGLQSGRPVYTENKYRLYYTSSMNTGGKININILDIITQDVLLKTKIEQTF